MTRNLEMNRLHNLVWPAGTNKSKRAVYAEGWLDHIPHDGPQSKLMAPPDLELTDEYVLNNFVHIGVTHSASGTKKFL